MKEVNKPTRTAGEAGWRLSRYNLAAAVPDTDQTVIVNLMRGNCAVYSLPECALLGCLRELDERHPLLERFARRGVIVNYDELAVLSSLGRLSAAARQTVHLTICPTMGCNFDCPYCFENHRPGKMPAEIQEDVIRLAGRMLDASGAGAIYVTWFGGEPLLAPDVIGSMSEKLIRLAAEKKAEYSAGMITNGYLLDRTAVETLERAKVASLQITLDGIGEAHDATRPLAGGGPTFDRIVSNLRREKLPFAVTVRHNVHEGNLDTVLPLAEFIEGLAEESGNSIHYSVAPVAASQAAKDRGSRVEALCGAGENAVGIARDVLSFRGGGGNYCGATNIFSVGTDEQGRLYKCWEDMDKPERSFGSVRTWDPADPLFTAEKPDLLTGYLNAACPPDDPECRECVWLPVCRGGCPNRRMHAGRACLPYKDDPGKYVLALYERMRTEKR